MAKVELDVTEEFEGWFAALPEPDAEEVASALDVVAEIGPALSPVRAARALLWFDGTAGQTDLPAFGGSLLLPFQDLVLWRKEVLRVLESPGFAARLAAVDRRTAERVLAAVASIRGSVKRTRTLDAFTRYAEAPGRVPDPEDLERLARARLGFDAGAVGRSLAELEGAFIEAVRLVGLEPGEVLAPAGLRELTVRTLTPMVRVLYGIDPGRGRMLVLCGDRLDRAYYGDSVRFAERRFADYLGTNRAESARP